MINTAALAEQSRDYPRILQAISYIEAHSCDQPKLDAVGAAVGLSFANLQSMFKRWAGISPGRLVQFLTRDHARKCLEKSASQFDATLNISPSRVGHLHELFANYKEMTPGDLKGGGDDIEIFYGIYPSPFGPCFIGETEYGVCALGYTKNGALGAPLADFQRRWPNAQFCHHQSRLAAKVSRIFVDGSGRLALDIRGANFQLKVWRALLCGPPGAMVSYSALAGAMNKPGAARAVGGAVAANPVSYLIPCHRVIRKSGHFHSYYWRPERKRAILAWEAARFSSAA